ncbi:SMP-30/gluconolactonase/LRE family protein [Burkholderia lata]|uniref:Xylono-1,4-lactonase n=1 Tax=Burkholderia lata (strain ATCC 17760 / DSM 23089 / LMG 22485 / NCIMB 9086 / R18194 / 383) TaxID=482957 RepID=A0A6P2NUE6_BURL3|nr:SMP-30/gluconolactonase/LRE family protein [Burkholderia lata]VWB98467.1 Xylono-1,4-lactonase [Burkholderia lata]
MRKPPVRLVCDALDVLGESPVWNANRSSLHWVDIRRGLLHTFDPNRNTHVERAYGPTLLTGIVLTDPDTLVAGRPRSLERIELELPHTPVTILNLDLMPAQNRTNELKTDSRGRLWFGSMWDYARGSTGGLHCIASDGRLTTHRRSVTIPNSLAFTPDGTGIYFADSITGAIERASLDPETNEVGAWEICVPASAAPGKPDGLALDASGHFWSARFGAGCIIRFDPLGREVQRIDLPVSQPTSCAFGGANLRTLFITTARQGLTQTQLTSEPLAGGLFAVDVDIVGLPVSFANVLPSTR